MNVCDYIFKDLMSEEAEDDFLECLFSNDNGVNANEIVKLIRKRKNENKIDIPEEQKEECDIFIEQLENNSDSRSIFIAGLMQELEKEFPVEKIMILNPDTFWYMFAIAIKKCLNSPKSVFVEKDYFNSVESQYEDLTKEQKIAHKKCVTGFNFDADTYRKQECSTLKELLHPMRSFKRDKDKKKHINRVLRKTTKIMQVYKLNHRIVTDNVLSGKRYIVPKQFTKTIVKKYLK